MNTTNHFKIELDHLQAIEAIAEEIDCPVEEVSKIYTSILENLKANARIKDYLIVLASKNVRDVLRP